MSRVLHEQESRPAPERIYTDFVSREQFINILIIFISGSGAGKRSQE